MADIKIIARNLNRLIRDSKYQRTRLLSILSAAIAFSHPKITGLVLEYLKRRKIDRKAVLEVILQSHLVTGFPRMIEAALIYNELFGNYKRREPHRPLKRSKAAFYYKKGERLCRKIYGRNFNRLKNRFDSITPELFDWIIIDAYGKVLSRPGLKTMERELTMLAILIVDNQKRQMISHIMGSINAGADFDLIGKINEDIRPLAGSTRNRSAKKVIAAIEKKYENAE